MFHTDVLFVRGHKLGTTDTTNDLMTRERLLEAAEELFVERGYNHVTIRDICKTAGANVAAVNYYFRDKLGLYQEVLAKVIACTRPPSRITMKRPVCRQRRDSDTTFELSWAMP